MAVYKVPQDVEADDKFLGPLSFKQFLFFGGFAISGYLSFLTLTRVWPVSIIFIIPMILFGFLAFPWSKEQPTELFLASRIRFLIKPRKRIWNQSGIKDLVNITVPVREAHLYSDGLSQGEVKKRFSALATIVDSRGWAVKNVVDDTSDRLVRAPVVSNLDDSIIENTPDMFDDSSGTIAKQFDSMIDESERQHKSETMRLIEDARRKTTETIEAPTKTKQARSKNHEPKDVNNQDFWFLHNQPQPSDPSLATFQSSTVVTPGAVNSATNPKQTLDESTDGLTEEELLEKVHKKQAQDALQTVARHEKVIDPKGQPKTILTKPVKNDLPTESIKEMTPPSNPDIINLAQSNDLSVETLSRQANKKKDFGDDEVVISLH